MLLLGGSWYLLTEIITVLIALLIIPLKGLRGVLPIISRVVSTVDGWMDGWHAGYGCQRVPSPPPSQGASASVIGNPPAKVRGP